MLSAMVNRQLAKCDGKSPAGWRFTFALNILVTPVEDPRVENLGPPFLSFLSILHFTFFISTF